jgi:uncharacterized protein (DUF433 family)
LQETLFRRWKISGGIPGKPGYAYDMKWQDYITADPAVLVGKPVIRGTRLAVEFILELMAQGWPENEILRNYHLQPEQVRACAAYARARLSEEKVFSVAA